MAESDELKRRLHKCNDSENVAHNSLQVYKNKHHWTLMMVTVNKTGLTLTFGE